MNCENENGLKFHPKVVELKKYYGPIHGWYVGSLNEMYLYYGWPGVGYWLGEVVKVR